jgi:triosephosphate isomerase
MNSTPSARIPLIAGNWKMNTTPVEADALLNDLATRLAVTQPSGAQKDVLVFPPFTSLGQVQRVAHENNLSIAYGAQDLSPFDSGAYTGDISGAFLSALGCTYVLIGHSERRTIHNEDEETIKAKVTAAYRHNLIPVLCVGEPLDIRNSENHVEFTLDQLRAAVGGLSGEQAFKLVVAYEPVWAIGTGAVAGPEDAQEMCAAIRTELAALFTAELADRVRVLYGGSVKGNNAAAIFGKPDVDGGLVGGASLDPDDFARICNF